MSKLDIFFKALFEVLQKVIPGLVGAFFVGYNMASKQTQKAQAALRAALLKLKYSENKNAIDEKFKDKSAADIVESVTKGELK